LSSTSVPPGSSSFSRFLGKTAKSALFCNPIHLTRTESRDS
jgi:hypothetical protein